MSAVSRKDIEYYARFFKPLTKTRPRTKNADDTRAWEWKRRHPKQWKWLLENYGSNLFARSVGQYIHLFGEPTVAQQSALDQRIPE